MDSTNKRSAANTKKHSCGCESCFGRSGIRFTLAIMPSSASLDSRWPCCKGPTSAACRKRQLFLCCHGRHGCAGCFAAAEWHSVLAVMATLPAEIRRKKVLPFCRLLFQSPDMESQVARCMALQFPTVLSQVSLSSSGCTKSSGQVHSVAPQ